MDGIIEEEGPKKIYECFFIVNIESVDDTSQSPLFQFPENEDEKELQQYKKFCFPFKKSEIATIGQRHQHFTFMLTDLEKRHKYGFCKLTHGGNICFCIVSVLPWFEIFYKILNCMYSVYGRNDLNTLDSLLNHLYGLPIPKPKEIVTISTSLTFCIPDLAGLPSIPENRNLMEYYSALSPKTMIEIFAALMFERRVVFTSKSLTILTSCIYAAESLIHPLAWQHIFIPILPSHLIDYCSAPMPLLIGIHSTLFLPIKNMATTEGAVIVDIDENQVDNPYEDVQSMPSDVVSYLRSQLGKPNVAVGSNLAEAFLKAQARLIGCYRSALKFRMGESIVFDEQKFIDMHKPGTRRSFAEALVQLQTFQEFLDKRLDMLNNGVGFRDAFENEITNLQMQDGERDSAVYKEWLAVTKKGGLLLSTVKKRAKSNMKSAKETYRQSMRDMKSAMKSTEDVSRPSLRSRQSLRESIKTLRPPRPPPPQPNSPNTPARSGIAPARPPPPKPGSIRHYNVIDLSDYSPEEEEEEKMVNLTPSPPKMAFANISLLEEINSNLKDEGKDIPLLIDFSLDSSSPTVKESKAKPNIDFFAEELKSSTLPATSQNTKINDPFSSFVARDNNPGIVPPRRSSVIRRADHVKTRPRRSFEHPQPQQKPSTNLSDDLLGLSFDDRAPVNSVPLKNNGNNSLNWVDFSNESYKGNESKSQGIHATQNKKANGVVQSSNNEPLISFDSF